MAVYLQYKSPLLGCKENIQRQLKGKILVGNLLPKFEIKKDKPKQVKPNLTKSVI